MGKFSFFTVLSALLLLVRQLNLPAQRGYMLFSKTHSLAARSLLAPFCSVGRPPCSLHRLPFPVTALPAQIALLTCHILPQTVPTPSYLPSQGSSLPLELSSHQKPQGPHLWGGHYIYDSEGLGMKSTHEGQWHVSSEEYQHRPCHLNLATTDFLVIHAHPLLGSKLADGQDQFLAPTGPPALPCM